MSTTGKQTPAEIEALRIKGVLQNAVVRVVLERKDLVKTVLFQKLPTSRELTNQQFVADCLKHPERFATGGPSKSQSRTWLHQLIFLQDLEAVNALIKAGQDVNAVDDLGRTALHYASAIGSRPIVETLLRKGAFKDVELADQMGYRPLHLAAEGGYHGVIKALIKEGEADVNAAGPDGFQPLHLICQAGNGVACFAALLTVGDKLDLKEADMYGRTPQDILRDVMGKGYKTSNAAQAVRRDKRGPWKLLDTAFSHEIRRRKDVLYLRYQEIEEKEKKKQAAIDLARSGAKAQVAKAMALAKAAFERGETVDWAALGLDPDMEDELRVLMDNEEEDEDDEEDEDYGYDDEEEEDDDEDGGDEEEDEDEGGGEDAQFPHDYIDGSAGGGEAGKMQMAAMAMTMEDDDDDDEELEASEGQKGTDMIKEKQEREEDEDEGKTGLLEETYDQHLESDDDEEKVGNGGVVGEDKEAQQQGEEGASKVDVVESSKK